VEEFDPANGGHAAFCSRRDWWSDQSRLRYPQARRLLILADSGGSNGCRLRMWKAQLQEELRDACGLDVTLCHYPTECSKWNPIEHRPFSHISLNWAGVRSMELHPSSTWRATRKESNYSLIKPKRISLCNRQYW
jgi:hypothetical protein